MAENGKIQSSLETVQKAVNQYVPGFAGPQDGALEYNQLPQGLYEELENFVYTLSQIDFVADFLQQNNIVIADAYDPAIKDGLDGFAASADYAAFRDMVAQGDQSGAQNYLRDINAPAAFVADPQKLVDFIEHDRAGFTGAMDALDAEGFLSAPPAAPELLARQPEALAGLQAVLDTNYKALIENFQTLKEKQEEVLSGEPEEAVRIEAQSALDLLSKVLPLLEKGKTHLDKADFSNFEKDADAQAALETYILYMQRHESMARVSDAADITGQYTPEFAEHYAGVIAAQQPMKDSLEQKGRLGVYEQGVLDQINRLAPFHQAMALMLETGAYRPKAASATAAEPVPDTPVRGVMPQVMEFEAPGLRAVLGRVPAAELAGVNTLVKTLSGYGFEEFMPFAPDDAGADALKGALAPQGQDRQAALAALYESVYQEAQGVLKREGRPASALEMEMKLRLAARLDDVTDGHDVFDPVQVDRLTQYLESAVGASFVAYNGANGDEAARARAAAQVFALSIPSPESFIERHGSNARSYRSFQNDYMTGIVPEIMTGFAGEAEKIPARGGGAEGTVSLAEAGAMPTLDALIADIQDDFAGLQDSPIAQKTLADMAEALAEKKAGFEKIYAQSDARGENGALILSDRTGHKVLLTPAQNGALEVRYLDALGVRAMEGAAIPEIRTGDEFGLDALMVSTAMAGFQATNQMIENPDHFAPGFFEMNGQHFVVGIDRETSMTQVKRLTPEFLSAATAGQLVNVSGPMADADMTARLMQDDAYRFIHKNYEGIFMNAGSVDRIFETMLEKVAGGTGREADNAALALQALGAGEQYIYKAEPEFSDLPRVSDQAVLDAVQAEIADRPDAQKMESFLYLHKDGHDGRVMLAIPATKDIVTGTPPEEQVETVYDESAAPLVFDISDAAHYTALRDKLVRMEGNEVALRMDVQPPENWAEPEFSGFTDWVYGGGAPQSRPEVTQSVLSPALPAATEQGRAALALSADEFTQGDDGKITFGRPVTDVGALGEVLGYDPAVLYRQTVPEGAPATVLVHGVDPETWNNTEGTAHPFLTDHVLITFGAGADVVTVAMKKEDFMHNPLRLPEMIQSAFHGDIKVDVQRVNSEVARTGMNGDGAPPVAENLWSAVLNNDFMYKGPAELLESSVREIRFAANPKHWMTDAHNYSRAMKEADHSALPQQGEPDSRQAMFRENCSEITCAPDMDVAFSGDTRAPRQPVRLGA